MARLFLVVFFLHISGVKPECVCETKGKNSKCLKEPDVCQCKTGFKPTAGNAFNCKDINECLGKDKSDDCLTDVPDLYCQNIDGGYVCQCPDVFTGDGRKSGTGCTDKNECADTKDKKCVGGTCINLVATKDSTHIGYKCNCSAGYTVKFGDSFCEEQQCRFSPNQTANARPGNCPKQQDGYILLKPVSNPTCELGCADGYAKNDAVYTCLPNNPDGSRVENNRKGVTKGSMQCIEQKCTIKSIADFGLNSVAGSCDGPLNALTGKQTCTLGCRKGFLQMGGAVKCSPNKDEPEGTISGQVTCTGTPCGHLVVPNSDHSDGRHNTSTTLETMKVTCDDGYLGGSSIVLCSAASQTTSAWSGIPTCTAAPCGKLVVEFSDHSTGAKEGVTGDSVRVGCADGYIGDAAIATCDPNGPGKSVWKGMPQCKAATCRDLTIPHGKISSTSKSKTMDTVQIICDKGFNLVNGTSATCSPVGPGESDWTSVPACEAAECPTFTVKDSDKQGVKGTKVGEQIRLKCNNAESTQIVNCELPEKEATVGKTKKWIGEWTSFQDCDVAFVSATTTADNSMTPAVLGGIVGSAFGVIIIIIAVVVIIMSKNKGEQKVQEQEEARTNVAPNAEPLNNFDAVEKQFENEMLGPNAVVLGTRLAIGGHASIFQGTFGSEEVVLKEDSYHGYEGLDEDTIQETRIMLKTRHPYIVRFFGLWISPQSNRLFMVMEYCMNGDLGAYIKKHGAVSKLTKYTWAVQMTDAMVYLHGRTIIHRDLKPGNILLNSNLCAKLADFGIAREVNETRDLTIQVGTVAFMPPEAMDMSDDEDEEENDKKVAVDGKKWDVYSMSIVFAFVFTGKEVYPGLTNPRIFRGVPKGKRPDTEGVDEGMVQLMNRMWTKRHTQRPTMAEVLEEVKRIKDVECVEEKGGSSSDDDVQKSPMSADKENVQAAAGVGVDGGAPLIEAGAASVAGQSQLPDSDSSSSSDHDHDESGEI